MSSVFRLNVGDILNRRKGNGEIDEKMFVKIIGIRPYRDDGSPVNYIEYTNCTKTGRINKTGGGGCISSDINEWFYIC